MDCTENNTQTATHGRVVLDLIPYGTNQWVPMPRLAKTEAPKELHFARFDYQLNRWKGIVDKAILARLTPIFKATAARHAEIHAIYQWASGDRIFVGDCEIVPGETVRLKVEVM